MSNQLLTIRDLSAKVGDKEILHNINLDINEGETHVLLGPNGAGKSTLGTTLMGNPVFDVTGGTITFDGQDITKLSADKRANLGMFYSFQNPIEIPGVTLESFIRNAIRQHTGKPVKIFAFKKELEETMNILNMSPSYADRDLNVGFSGGEKKKAEILQMLMLNPKFAILDETDSGLDIDAVRTVSHGIEEYQKTRNGSLLIITHSTKILEALHVHHTHIIVNGTIVKSGDASLIDEINQNGFEKYINLTEGAES